MVEKLTTTKISRGVKKVLENGCKATDIIFQYLEDNILKIPGKEISCVRGQWDTGYTLLGMKIWVDDSIKDNCFYLIDRTEMIYNE